MDPFQGLQRQVHYGVRRCHEYDIMFRLVSYYWMRNDEIVEWWCNSSLEICFLPTISIWGVLGRFLDPGVNYKYVRHMVMIIWAVLDPYHSFLIFILFQETMPINIDQLRHLYLYFACSFILWRIFNNDLFFDLFIFELRLNPMSQTRFKIRGDAVGSRFTNLLLAWNDGWSRNAQREQRK